MGEDTGERMEFVKGAMLLTAQTGVYSWNNGSATCCVALSNCRTSPSSGFYTYKDSNRRMA